MENVFKLHCISGFQEIYASVATTLSESYGNVVHLCCCNVIQGHCSNVEQQSLKCSHLMLPQRRARKLQKHCHNVEGKLWKRWPMKLLQHIPGKFQECCSYVKKMISWYAAKHCKKTSPQHYGNIHWQRRSVMIFTMLWQPFCNMGKSA